MTRSMVVTGTDFWTKNLVKLKKIFRIRPQIFYPKLVFVPSDAPQARPNHLLLPLHGGPTTPWDWWYARGHFLSERATTSYHHFLITIWMTNPTMKTIPPASPSGNLVWQNWWTHATLTNLLLARPGKCRRNKHSVRTICYKHIQQNLSCSTSYYLSWNKASLCRMTSKIFWKPVRLLESFGASTNELKI